MTMKQVTQALSELNIDFDTISICSRLDGEEVVDAEYTYCDLSGNKTECFPCTALTRDGSTIEFIASIELIGGHLGKIARAF